MKVQKKRRMKVQKKRRMKARKKKRNKEVLRPEKPKEARKKRRNLNKLRKFPLSRNQLNRLLVHQPKHQHLNLARNLTISNRNLRIMNGLVVRLHL